MHISSNSLLSWATPATSQLAGTALIGWSDIPNSKMRNSDWIPALVPPSKNCSPGKRRRNFYFFPYFGKTFHAEKCSIKYWELLKDIEIMYVFIAVESLKWLCFHFPVWHRSLILHMFSDGNAELDYGEMDNAALMLAWANKKTAMNPLLQIEVHAFHIITQGLSLRLDDCITLIL